MGSTLVQHSCVAEEPKPAAVDPDGDSVKNFAEWAKFKTVCQTVDTNVTPAGTAMLEPKEACLTAATEGRDQASVKRANNKVADNWNAMCTALDGFDCTVEKKATGEITEFDSCCLSDDETEGCQADQYTKAPSGGGGVIDWSKQATCCAACITASQTTTATTHGPTTSPTAPGPKPAPTGEPTTVAPGPEPTPSPSETETTTGPSDESTENVTEPDSAFHLGPSGLLVTLFAMMAAVLNIA